MDLAGKKVVVTGASSGIGAAIAGEMAKEGAVVALLARNMAALQEVQRQIEQQGGAASIHAVDLSEAEAAAEVAQRIMTEIGVPDIVVNNAGSGQWKFLEETSPEEIRQMMALPYFAAAYLTRAFLPAMRARGSGHIVNISSVASRFVWPGATAYTAARWALRGFTEALRADLHGSGIGITLYESGEVASPYWEHNPASRERIPKIGRLIPVLMPQQAAQAVVAGVRHNKRLVVAPLMMRFIYLQHRLFPWLVQWLMTVTGYKRR